MAACCTAVGFCTAHSCSRPCKPNVWCACEIINKVEKLLWILQKMMLKHTGWPTHHNTVVHAQVEKARLSRSCFLLCRDVTRNSMCTKQVSLGISGRLSHFATGQRSSSSRCKEAVPGNESTRVPARDPHSWQRQNRGACHNEPVQHAAAVRG